MRNAALNMGAKDVTTADTPEALVAAATYVRSIAIQAKPINTNNVFIGLTGLTNDSTTGWTLTPGSSVTIEPPLYRDANALINIASILVDAITNGEGVTFIYITDEVAPTGF